MKKRNILISLIGISMAFNLIQAPHASADAQATPSIVDQIEHPNKGTTTNNNKARNWEISGSEHLIQATTNGEIPYKIKSKNPYYQKIWRDAINGWNNLGVIKFVPVTSNQQITLSGEPNTNRQDDWYGITGNDILADNDNPDIGYMLHASAKLAGDLSQKPNHYTMNLDIAEHEIGHTLGFAHDNSRSDGKYRIMHDGTSLLFTKNIRPLGEYEKQTLLQYYKPGQTQAPDGGMVF